jgi:hypothetical protein
MKKKQTSAQRFRDAALKEGYLKPKNTADQKVIDHDTRKRTRRPNK